MRELGLLVCRARREAHPSDAEARAEKAAAERLVGMLIMQ